MILEKQKEANILQQGESQDSIGMSLDLDSAQILMQMLSKNLYSDSIGSTIRECASNALDSHRRVGVDKPIVVSFSRNSSDNYEFSVEDFGIGLDADDVKNIISKYGKSTKRDSNTELGMMGLGFKAPLAYSSSFYFVCRKDGIERKYMMYEGEDVNTIDLLYEQSTTEVNGVKVIVPVKWQDRSDFINKINEQLAYFENVYFNVEGINNDFLIHRNDIFQFSELSKETELHICLDNVYYPLDFIKLGIDRIRIPIGLKFSLTDGLFPTPNRESLRYTQESKQIILDKIAKLADYMIEKYNDSITSSADINTVFDYYSNYTKTVNIIGNGDWEIENLLKFSVLKVKEPKVDGIELLDLKLLHKHRDYIFGEYEVMYFLERDKMREAKNYWNKKLTASNAGDKCYLFTGVLGSNKRVYMRETLSTKSYGSPTYNFVKKKVEYKLGDRSSTGMTTYFEILNLGLHPKTEWRQRITEFQSIQNMFISKMKNLDEIVIPKSWLDARKTVRTKGMSNSRVDDNGKRIIKLQGEIVGKIGVDLERYNDGRKCKFVPVTKELNKVPREKNLIIYAHHDDYLKLDPLYEIMAKQPVKIMTFSSREMNILKDIEIHNLITYDKFMEGKNKTFKRIVTAHLIYNLVMQHKSTFNYMRKLKGVCTNLYDKLELLDKYQNDNYTHSSPSVFEAMLTVAKEHNLFDHEIYHVYNEIKDVFEKLPFLNALMPHTGSYGDNKEVIDAIVDLMKYHKFKVNLDRYNLKLDEEIASELTEELIDELAN